MHLEMRSALRDGPRRAVKTNFAAAAILITTLFSSCAHGAPPPKSNMSLPQPTLMANHENHQTLACGADVRSALDEGERITGSVCTPNYEFVLTNTSLLIFPRDGAKQTGDSSITFSHMRNRIDSLIGDGIVDWDATDKAAFFVLRDNSLVIMPLKRDSTTLPTYVLAFDTGSMGKDRMTAFGGMVFIASPSGDVLALSYSDKAQMNAIKTDITNPDAKLFVADGKLFFGKKDGKKVEIKVEGPDSVSLVR